MINDLGAAVIQQWAPATRPEMVVSLLQTSVAALAWPPPEAVEIVLG
jgi:hypothetical protein